MKFFITNLTIAILITGLASCGSSKNSTSERQINQKTTTNDVHKTTDVKEPESKVENESVTKEEVSDPSIRYLYKTTTEDYIRRFSGIAQTKMRKHKIPASITLAQGILESNSGNSTLSVGYNNHFGIKCNENWYGDRTYYDDDEKNECFRAYQSPEESYEDHALFLTKRQRYAGLFDYDISDYESWAHGLKNAGYATDKQYAYKLINLIKKYNLDQYDNEVITSKEDIVIEEQIKEVIQTAPPSIPKDGTFKKYEDPSNYHIVKQGESLEQIAQMYGMTKEQLKSINGMYDETIYPHQRLTLIAQPKPFSDIVRYSELTQKETKTTTEDLEKPIKVIEETNNEVPEPSTEQVQISKSPLDMPEYHKVKDGETLESIAAKYGMNIEQIISYNGMLDHKVYPHMILKLKKQTDYNMENPQDNSISEKRNDLMSDPINLNTDYHVVEKGETLYSISRKYELTIDELRTLNQLENDNLQVGQKLYIKTNNTKIPDTQFHTVQQGETLYSISKQYEVSVESIKALNNLSDTNLFIGQQLKIR